MDAIMIVGGLGMAGMVMGTVLAWNDPQAAEKLAAKLRGRAVELRMLAVARQEARAQARYTEKACLHNWGPVATEPPKEAEDHA